VTHDYHEGLPGYSPEQLLHAGCGECDQRAAEPSGGLAHLDMTQFARAWHRAEAYRDSPELLPDLDPAEVRMLSALWAVQVQLERFGVPIGYFPVSPAALTGWLPA
jgi:hypothetical protein